MATGRTVDDTFDSTGETSAAASSCDTVSIGLFNFILFSLTSLHTSTQLWPAARSYRSRRRDGRGGRRRSCRDAIRHE